MLAVWRSHFTAEEISEAELGCGPAVSDTSLMTFYNIQYDITLLPSVNTLIARGIRIRYGYG